VYVVLDEFQELVSIDENLPGRIRAVFQRQDRVAHVFLGSRRHLMAPLFLDHAGPLYRSAKPLLLRPIPPKSFAPFLRQRFAEGGVRIADPMLERVLALTGGLPYETQELCSYAWTAARLEGEDVDETLLHDALERLLDAESARYTALWDQITARQRALRWRWRRSRGASTPTPTGGGTGSAPHRRSRPPCKRSSDSSSSSPGPPAASRSPTSSCASGCAASADATAAERVVPPPGIPDGGSDQATGWYLGTSRAAATARSGAPDSPGPASRCRPAAGCSSW
jgi:hypothetical protein